MLVGPAWAGITVPPSTSEKAALHLGQPEASGNFWINLEDGQGYQEDIARGQGGSSDLQVNIAF